jgi:uncharacterized RDD family membrane protein YckC
MAWHYIENGQQAGPVDEATFNSLVSAGRITPDTQVWREGMANWAPYASIGSPAAVASATGSAQCAECGNTFAADDLVQIGGRAVCATCKPIAVQKLKEGVTQTGEFRYAGFWIRFAAYFVDGLIMYVVQTALRIGLTAGASAENLRTVSFVLLGLNFIIQAAYSIWFVGNPGGSTLGMMACGIKVVKADGDTVGYGRAAGRFFAAILSSMIAGIGYLMIAFDEEKRALHDRICDTRVIYKK